VAFNSYAFLLIFLPLVTIAYRVLGRLSSPVPRLLLLIGATLGFYALAAAWALPLLLGSIAVNLGFAWTIAQKGRLSRPALVIGVTANVALLVAIKYGYFLADNLAHLVGAAPWIGAIALPLGLSFYTFQQIAFLVDTARERTGHITALGYVASILFFPTIVSGPIVFYREFGPQVQDAPERKAQGEDIFVGIALIILGLLKKTVIADSLALWVDPLFAGLGSGHSPGAAMAWALVLGFLLQMYFDFSGYSDMALGAARLLGIRLVPNFHSPLRVTSIVDWWRRWHMSLGRFVGDYIFQPLALVLTRTAARRSLTRKGAFALGVLVPTFVAMLTIGAWHGGNWTFIVFGLLHASYMVIAETWRFARRRGRRGRPVRRWHLALGNVATITAVLVALVPFRAPDMHVALVLWQAMAGLGSAPATVVWPVLPGLGGAGLGAMIAAGLFIAYLLPNTAQLLGRYRPHLAWSTWASVSPARIRFTIVPGWGWGLILGMLAFWGLAFVSRGSGSFVYFGF
jgi:D-alanyl-lipoteichoic acid acyltransferase DltB (MBOAT superfamily)